MNQLNVRNVDDTLWREVRAEAEGRGIPVGCLLNEILSEWIGRLQHPVPYEERLRRAHAAMGMFAHLFNGKSAADEVREMRDLDRKREDELFERFQRAGASDSQP